MSSLTVHIETWGCQMNVADSEQMHALLEDAGYRLVADAEQADLVVLNTCHIRDKATHKVLSRLGVLGELKATRSGQLTIAVAGCVAQAEGKRLLEQSGVIDILLGPGKIQELPKLVAAHRRANGERQLALGFPKNHEEFDQARLGCQSSAAGRVPPLAEGKNSVSRFVNIQVGCDNFCTFCVVPQTRGRELSLPPEEIVQRVEALVAAGSREVTLLGQNVNSYGNDLVRVGRLAPRLSSPFVALLQRVAAISGLQRLRFTTSNPHDLTPELAALFGREPKLGAYYHLPLQSGSDRILEQMRRKVTAAQYLERIAWLRQARPDIVVSTDLIVGFPGEGDDDFAHTLDLVRRVRFGFVYAFAYSPRRGTAAARFRDAVPLSKARERLAQLNALQDAITLEEHRKQIGKECEVLFLYPSRKEPATWYGRSEQFRLVKVSSPNTDLLGTVRPVRICDANKTALVGECVG